MPFCESPDDFDYEKLEVSLDRKNDDFRRSRESPRDEPLKDDIRDFARDPKNIERIPGLGKSEKITFVNMKLKENFIDIDESLLDVLFEKTQSPSTVTTSDEHPTMNKVLNEVNRKFQSEPEFLRSFISSGIRYCWIGFRKGSKELAGLEQILDGLHKKDLKIIAKGVVTFTLGPTLSTILFKLVGRINT